MAASKSGFGNSSEPANRLASLSAPSCSLSWKVRCPHSWPRPNLKLSPETAGSKAITGIPFTHADSPSTPGNPTTGTRQTPARSTRAVMLRIGPDSSCPRMARSSAARSSMSSRSETGGSRCSRTSGAFGVISTSSANTSPARRNSSLARLRAPTAVEARARCMGSDMSGSVSRRFRYPSTSSPKFPCCVDGLGC